MFSPRSATALDARFLISWQKARWLLAKLPFPFAISRPAVSQHLRILRDAGLVSVRREGREQIYSLRATPIREVYDWAEHYQRFWPDRLSALGKHLDRQP